MHRALMYLSLAVTAFAVAASTAFALPSCCAAPSSTTRPVQASLAGCCSAANSPARPVYKQSGFRGGCCGSYASAPQASCCGVGASGYSAGSLPACCSPGGTKGARYSSPALPPCCAAGGAASTFRSPAPARPIAATAVPASAGAASAYKWGVYPANSGPFGRPAYFSGSALGKKMW